MFPCLHASMLPSIQASKHSSFPFPMLPCFYASMLLYFLIPWFHTSMIPWFHDSMFSCFNDSMIPASMLSGLHVRQVRHVRISLSTIFKKCDSLTHWLTDSQTWPLIQMLSHLITTLQQESWAEGSCRIWDCNVTGLCQILAYCWIPYNTSTYIHTVVTTTIYFYYIV